MIFNRKSGLVFFFLLSVLILTLGIVSASDNANLGGSAQNIASIELNDYSIENDHLSIENENSNLNNIVSNDEIGNDISSSNEDNSQYSSIISGNTFTDIQEGINSNEDGIIELNNNFTYDENIDGDFSNGITINKNLTIDGKGHTIDANSNGEAVRIFNIRNSEVVIKNLIFKNAYVEENGAAILITNSKVTIQNCTFLDNYAKNYGGAIRFYGPNGNIINCTFENNNATHGGAIYWSNGPNGTLKDSIFVNNHGARGGAVYWFSADGTIENCTFENNTANGNHGGGAVYWYGNNGSIIDSTFINNTAFENYASGGAVYWYYGANGLIHNSTFINNSAEYGGAVRWDTHNGRIRYSNFTDNYGNYKSGAVLWNGVNGTVLNSSFYNNSAKTAAGSILLNDSENIEIINSTFNETNNVTSLLLENCVNSSIIGSSFISNYHAIDWVGTDAKIIECTFYNNQRPINFNGNNLIISNSSFFENSKSSMLYANNSLIIHCNFNDNIIYGMSGAIYISGNGNSISSTTFQNNMVQSASTPSYGGAVYIFGNDNFINSSTFLNNTAMGNIYACFGGAVYISGNDNSISSSIFEYNNAYSKNMDPACGGAVYISGNDNFINSSSFFKNSAIDSYGINKYGQGGSIYLNSSNNSIKFSNFTNNSASSCGGAISFVGNSYFENCNFLFNNINARNDAYGGAVFSESYSSLSNFSYCNFTSNGIKFSSSGNLSQSSRTAYGFGGAIYSGLMPTNVFNSNFSKNYVSYQANLRAYTSQSTYNFYINLSGGAIYNNGSYYYGIINPSYINNCSFVNNTLIKNIVIYNQGNNIIKENLSIQGGALFFMGNSKINNSNFIENSHVSNILKYNSSISNSKFLHNEGDVEWDGSVRYSQLCGLNITNSSFIGSNFLSLNLSGFNVKIHESRFTNCSNRAIYSNASTTISKSSFINNSVVGYGSAIYFCKGGIINTSSFINNYAQNGSAAIFYQNSTAQVSNSIFITNKGQLYNDIYSSYSSKVNYNYWGSNNGPDGQALSPSVTYDNYVLFNIESPGDYVLWEDNVSIYGGLIQYTDGTNIYNMTEDMPPLTIKLLVDIGEVDSLVIDSPDAKVNASYYAANVGYETFSVKIFDITETTIFEVIDKKASQLIANNISVIYGGDNIFEVRFTDNKNSSYENMEINLYIDGILFDTKTTSNKSIAYFNISNLTCGNHSIYLEFVGDDEFIGTVLSNLWIFVEKSNVTISMGDIVSTMGEYATLSAQVTDNLGNPVNIGLVRFYIDNQYEECSNVDNGTANILYNCTYGNFTIFASYEENEYYYNSSVTANLIVNKYNTSLSISVIPQITLGETFCIDVNVLSNNHIVYDGLVEFYIDNVKIGSSNVNNGRASLSYILNVSDNYSLLVSYLNGTDFEPSQAVTTLEVNKINSFINATNATSFCDDISFIDVMILDQYGKEINPDFIKVYYENGTNELISLINNKLSIDSSKWASGIYNLTLEYLGDDLYSSSKINVILVVNKRDTSIFVENYSKCINDSFILYININSSNIVNEGNVSLFVNNQFLTLDVIDGIASFEYVCNEAGNFTYEIEYNGGESHNPSNNIFYVYVNETPRPTTINAKIIPINDNVDYQDGYFIFKLVDSDNDDTPLANATITVRGVNFYTFGNNNSSITPRKNFTSDEYGIITIENINMNPGYDFSSFIYNFTTLSAGKYNLTFSGNDSLVLNTQCEISVNKILAEIIASDMEGDFGNIEYSYQIVNSNTYIPLKCVKSSCRIYSDEIDENIAGITNLTGFYTIPNINLKSGVYNLEISSDDINLECSPITKTLIIDHGPKLEVINNSIDNHSSVFQLKLLTWDDEPISHVIITLEIDEEDYLSITDGKGIASFVLSDLDIGNYTVNVSLDGIYSALNQKINVEKVWINNTVIEEIPVSADASIRLVAGDGVVNIVLKDLSGHVLANEVLNVSIDGGEPIEVFTDDFGHATVEVSGNYSVRVIFTDVNGASVSASLTNSVVENTVVEYVDVEVPVTANATIEFVANENYVTVILKNLDGVALANKVLSVNVNGVDTTLITNAEGEANIRVSDNDTVKVVYTDANGANATASLVNCVVNNTVIEYVNVTEEVPVVANATIDLTVDANIVNITLKDLDGNTLANKVLSVTVKGVTINLITDAEGKTNIMVGDNDTVKVVYTDANGANATASLINSVVNNTVIEYVNVTEEVPVTANASIGLSINDGVVKVTLTDLDGKVLVANITVIVDGAETKTVTDSDGTKLIPIGENSFMKVIYTDKNGATVSASIINNVVKPVFNREATQIIFSDMITTAVDVDTDGRVGDYFIATLKDAQGKPLAGKPVQIGFNGKAYNRITDENGSCKLQINLQRADIYTFAVCFLGDDDYNGSFVVAKITVNAQKGSLTVPNKSYSASAKTKSLTATFKASSGKVVANKKVSFTVNGKTYSATTNANGVATVNVSLSTKGTYSFTAKFAGDGTYTAISKSAKLTIK